MAEKTEVLNLTIDVQAAEKNIESLTVDAKNLKKALDDLEKSEGRTSKAFKDTEKALEDVNKEIVDNQTLLKQSTKTAKDTKNSFGEIGDSLKDLSPAFGNAAQGAQGLGSKLLALAKNPIVLVAGAIVGIFTLLYKAFNRNEESSSKLSIAMGKLSGLFSGILKLLEPIADFVGNVLVKGFEVLGDMATKAIDLIANALEMLGFAETATDLKDFNKEMNNATEAGGKLAEMQREYDKALRASKKTQDEFEMKAEKYRQIRDDESKTLKQRKQANEDLNKTLQDQLAAELKIANQGLELQKQRAIVDGETKENLDAIAEAEANIKSIQNRLTGQESEYLANQNALRKEGIAASEALKTKKIADAKATTDAEIEQKNRLMLANIEYANAELELWKLNNQSKIDASKDLTQAIVDEENKRLTELEAKEKANLELKKQNELSNSKLTAEEKKAIESNYQVEILALEKEILQQKKDLNTNWEVQEADRKILVAQTNYENQKAIASQNFFEDATMRLEDLNKQQIEETETANKIGADVTLIDKKYANERKAIERTVADTKLGLAAGFTKDLATIFGEQSKVGKAFAAASTTIETYKSAVSAYSAMADIPVVGPALGIAAAGAATATGLAAVKKIYATDMKGGSTPSAPTVTSVPTPNISTPTSQLVGNSIVGRDVNIPQQTQQTTQTVLVVDEVTYKQSNQYALNKTSNL